MESWSEEAWTDWTAEFQMVGVWLWSKHTYRACHCAIPHSLVSHLATEHQGERPPRATWLAPSPQSVRKQFEAAQHSWRQWEQRQASLLSSAPATPAPRPAPPPRAASLSLSPADRRLRALCATAEPLRPRRTQERGCQIGAPTFSPELRPHQTAEERLLAAERQNVFDQAMREATEFLSVTVPLLRSQEPSSPASPAPAHWASWPLDDLPSDGCAMEPVARLRSSLGPPSLQHSLTGLLPLP
eukprot:EG_transcript_16902